MLRFFILALIPIMMFNMVGINGTVQANNMDYFADEISKGDLLYEEVCNEKLQDENPFNIGYVNEYQPYYTDFSLIELFDKYGFSINNDILVADIDMIEYSIEE